jgi:hypothetical protein
MRLCNCVDDESVRQVYRDILNTFNSDYGDTPGIYNDSEREEVINKYGDTMMAVLLNLLEQAGCIEHSGNLTSSAHLTAEGVEFREWVNRPYRSAVPFFAQDHEIRGVEYDEGGKHYKVGTDGWLYYKENGNWVSFRKLTESEKHEILESVVS